MRADAPGLTPQMRGELELAFYRIAEVLERAGYRALSSGWAIPLPSGRVFTFKAKSYAKHGSDAWRIEQEELEAAHRAVEEGGPDG